MAEKVEFKMEYILSSSTKILYNRLSTLSGLAEWFADDVNAEDDVFTFEWEGSSDQAKLISHKTYECIRFQWLEDEGTDYYFEFNIKTDGLSRQIALIITDFAEEDELEEAKNLWDAQIGKLKRIIGS